MSFYDFDTYQVYCFSAFSYDARIDCSSRERGEVIAQLCFYSEDAEKPVNEVRGSCLVINYRAHRFHEVMETLREEGDIDAVHALGQDCFDDEQPKPQKLWARAEATKHLEDCPAPSAG